MDGKSVDETMWVFEMGVIGSLGANYLISGDVSSGFLLLGGKLV